MRIKSMWRKLFALIFIAALFASCGGGGGGGIPFIPPSGEGTPYDPMGLGTVDTTPLVHPGRVGAYGTSYYTFTTGSMSGRYTIGLTYTQSNLSWALFDDTSSPARDVCYDFAAGDRICTTTLPLSVYRTYYLKVDEWDWIAGTYTLTITPPLPPVAPEGVIATAGYGKVTVSWNAVAGAASYNVYSSTAPGTGTAGTQISGITNTSYDDIGGTPQTTYYYVVTAQNANGESAASGEVSAAPLAPLTPPLTFNFDDATLQGWTTNGSWGVTTASYNSFSYSVTDSPVGEYTAYSNSSLISPMLDLTGTTNPALTFYHRYDIELNYDYGYVEISSDGGTTFGTPVQSFTGTQLTFTLVTIDLSPYKSSSTVVIRFRLSTDFIYEFDGWYIDDIAISQ